MAIRVILDSNFLMIPTKFRVDVFEELEKTLNQRVEAIVPSPIYDELKRISATRSPKQARQAREALKLAEKLRIFEVQTRPRESIDDTILRLASEWNCPVATNDAELRKKLKEKSIPVVYLRQRSHLEMDGSLFRQESFQH